MPVAVYIIVGIWLILQVPMAMLLGRYLRRVRRSYPRATEPSELHTVRAPLLAPASMHWSGPQEQSSSVNNEPIKKEWA